MTKNIIDIQRIIYQRILKPILFRLDPERVHDAFTLFGRALGATSLGRARAYRQSTITGIRF
ncbi:MAG: hypothetical protein AAB886_02260 [Patescibacteria group bacterium]